MSGRGTSGGVGFQGEVGAYAAALLLSERPINRLGDNLPGTPIKIFLESPSAVDDVNVVTDKGLLYFQAKTTVSLSTKADSELASVIDQFVRQFRAGVIMGNRKMDVRKDRLILAVSESTSGTVRNDLRTVLVKNRTGAATAIPQNEVKALKTITTLIKDVWKQEVGSVIPAKQLQEILKLCTVVVLDVGQTAMATEALRDVVEKKGDETVLFDELILWGIQAATLGTGGDQEAIRLHLQSKVVLKAPPSYESDILKLNGYSETILKRLRRFTTINTDLGEISFKRPVCAAVVEAAKNGHLAITGDPGAGKSGIVHDLSVDLVKDSVVITLTAESNLYTLDALQKQIGLEHSVVEVLKNITIAGQAYLVLDALDATRGGASEHTYRKLIDEVSMLPKWHVIASIRTFDLNQGLEWKKLFRGTAPDANFSNSQFGTVRHVHIASLGDDEFNQIGTQSPSLKLAISAGGEKITALARNLFNLSLIGELISSGTAPASLATMRSRSELLARYWDERVEGLGLQGTVALKTFAELVIAVRTIDIPETEIPQASTEYIERLHVNGVLVTEQTRRMAFRHHILLDYAISRLLLQPDELKAILHLSKSSGAGLLVSPSLEFWVEDLKKKLSGEKFWKLLVTLIGSEDIDPIIKVELSRLAIAGIQPGEDMLQLSRLLSGRDGGNKKALLHLQGTISTFGLMDSHPDDWAILISKIENVTEPYQLSALRNIIYVLFEHSSLSQNGLAAVGLTSRMLFDEMSKADELIQWFSSSLIGFLVKTYQTDPKATKSRLEQIFVKERFQKHGYKEVPTLARHATELAEYDQELVTALYKKVFAGSDFSTDQKTALGADSWILPLYTNAAQDFHMAEYYLRTAFSEILTKSPSGAIRAFAAALDGKKPRWASEPEKEDEVSYLDGQRAFLEDNSYYSELNSEHDALGNMYAGLMNWVTQAEDSELGNAPELILKESNKGLAWKVLFNMGRKRPEVIGQQMWNSALDSKILSSISTRTPAMQMIADTYPHMSEEERRKAEEKILASDFSETRDPEFYYRDTVSRIFQLIGAENLISDQAKAFLNEPSEERIPLADQGIAVPEANQTTDSDDNVEEGEHPAQTQTVSDSLAEVFEEGSDQEINELILLEDSLLIGTPEIDDLVNKAANGEAAIISADSIVKSLKNKSIPEGEQAEAIRQLLELSQDPSPLVHEDTEEQFERSPVWSGGSVRVDLARLFGELIEVPGIWPGISDRYRALLLQDPHPAVRMQAVLHISKLWDVDREAMWELAEKFVNEERNKSVLGYGAIELSRLKSCAAERLEPLFLKLSDVRVSSHRETAIPNTLAYLAFVKGLPGAQGVLSRWVSRFDEFENQLHGMLFSLRGYYGIGYAQGEDRTAAIRKLVIAFLLNLIKTLESLLKSWPTDREATAQEGAALKLLDEIGTQLFYAVGYDDSIYRFSAAEQRAFLDDYAEIMSILSTLGTPNTVHHCLQILEKLVLGNPEKCFDLISEAMLRTTGVAKYEHEPMGAELFVKLVGIYLADYRHIFADPDRRSSLVECLTVFVEAGWPQARRLFQTLHELR